MPTDRPRPLQSSTVIAPGSAVIFAEIHLRQAGRLLELQLDEEQQRLARVVFRLASRVRTDRLAVFS